MPECGDLEKNGTFVIDPKKCTECIGYFDVAQCVAVCPVDNTCVIDTALSALSSGGEGRHEHRLHPRRRKIHPPAFEVRRRAGRGFRLLVTPGGCSGMSADSACRRRRQARRRSSMAI